MLKRYVLIISLFIILFPVKAETQEKTTTRISGRLSIDNSWDSVIYLSLIPTFEDMYLMSNEMILAETTIDSLGYFQFNLDFLPKSDNLYRLHLIKNGDTPATLIIGGKDENHLFFIANSNSNIELINKSRNPPFRKILFKNSKTNTEFHRISQLVFVSDSIASESTASKRLLIESQMKKDLLLIADTSSNLMVSLYAVHKSDLSSSSSENVNFYKSYLGKWDETDNQYLKAFKDQLPVKDNGSNAWFYIAVIVLMSSLIWFLVIKSRNKNPHNFDKLSIQERKIYQFIQQGASNQEISDHFNIGLSTVKSHLSSIYSKLNVKSRKDIINLK
jgi:DNA-binding CsgD family transcriptional regulator